MFFISALLSTALLAGCGDDEQYVFTSTNNNAVVAPSAQNDSFPALGNATLNQSAAAGVLTNDTPNGGTITAFDAVGSQGGAISLNQDGSFTYTPVNNFVGTETFSYTLSNSAGDSTATVTLTSTARGRFVDNSVGTNGTGTQASPFNNLASAIAIAQSGDTIFVARGDGSNTGMTGGFTLPAGVNLTGEGTGLILAQTIVPAGQAPTLQGPITCGGNNVIKGITIDGSTSDLVVINGVGDVTISDSTLSNPTDDHISVINGSGTLNVLRNTLNLPSNNNRDYIDVDNASTNATIVANDNTFSTTAGQNVNGLLFIEPTGTSQIAVTFKSNVADGAAGQQFGYGVYLDNMGTGACTVDIDGNTFDQFNESGHYPIGVFSTNGPTSGSITNNTATNSGFAGIYASAGGTSSIAITGNTLDTTQYGVYSYFDRDGTVVVTDNTIRNSTNVAIYSEIFGTNATGKIAVRNNMLSSNTESFYGYTQNAGQTLCVDMTGNTLDSNIRFDGNNVGTVNVERKEAAQGGPLSSVNTFEGGAVVQDVNPTVTSVAAGACQIP